MFFHHFNKINGVEYWSYSVVATPTEVNVDFVPGNFYFEDSDFSENRSKHRNDLTMMKKLRDVAESNEKKLVVVVSKRKKNVVSKRKK
ncbi:hypothetical protein P3L10_012900 [Capsicum annuum]